MGTLVSDLRVKSFNLSLLNMMLAVGFPYIAFIMLRYVYSILNLLRVFTMKDVLFCQMFFLR